MNKMGPSWIGRTIGNRYKIESILGRGGMSSVYKAHDPNLKRTVAVKIIHQHLTDNSEFIKRFEQEAAVIAQLRHNNIVQVHDFNHDGDAYFMVMEYIPGETLAQKLEALKQARMRMPLPDTVRILTTICNAVDYAHQKRMIHRDLKPANVMINLMGEPVLMDFGIARMIGGNTGQTNTGAAMGTAAYMSPEQINGQSADHRADIYSLGIILFEMLSGTPPYDGDSTYEIMLKHLNEPLPNIKDIEANTPNSLVIILEKALEKDPEYRYQTAGEMGTALATLGVQLQGPADTLAARHIDNMTHMWQEARQLEDKKDWIACLAKLDALQQADPDFQAQKVRDLRFTAIDNLYIRAERHVDAGRFDEAQTAVKALFTYDPDYEGLDDLEKALNAGLAQIALRAELNQIYETAVAHLDTREYQTALDQWAVIQQQKGDLDFPDRLMVEKRAKEGMCADLYAQAATALAQKEPHKALSLLVQVDLIDPNYPDVQQIRPSAEAIIQKRGRAKKRNAAFVFLLLLVLIIAGYIIISGGIGGEEPTTEIPASAAAGDSAAVTNSTATNTPLPTNTPTAVPINTATQQPTSTATPLPTNTPTPEGTIDPYMAMITENANIYPAPDRNREPLAVLEEGTTVWINGRSETGNWLYITDIEGNEGFVDLDLIQWEGNIDGLTVKEEVALSAPPPGTTSGDLKINLYPLEDDLICNEDGSWTQKVYIGGEGGSGKYTYYWGNTNLGTFNNEGYAFDVSSGGASESVRGTVISGNLSATDEIFLDPDCN